MAHSTLTDLESRVLDFAVKRRPLHEARVVFGWRPTTYVMRLHRLLDDPRAEIADPINVRRLRKMRDERAAARAARQIAV